MQLTRENMYQMGLERKLRESLVRISDAEYQQSLLESLLRLFQVYISAHWLLLSCSEI